MRTTIPLTPRSARALHRIDNAARTVCSRRDLDWSSTVVLLNLIAVARDQALAANVRLFEAVAA